MHITKDTKMSDILEEYGDVADVMEVLAAMRIGDYSARSFSTRGLSVQRAAFEHRVPVDEFLRLLNKAIQANEPQDESPQDEASQEAAPQGEAPQDEPSE